jgi:quinol monooxygenase YgiN
MQREMVMIIELMRISISQTQGDRLGEALESLVGPIQVQPGCLECRLLKSSPTEKRMYVLARWETQRDLIRHLQSDSYKKLLLLVELSAAPPVMEFFNVLEIRGLDLVEAVRNSLD